MLEVLEESISSLCGCHRHRSQEELGVLFLLSLDLGVELYWPFGVRLSYPRLLAEVQQWPGYCRIDCGKMSRRRGGESVCHRE